MNEKERSNYMVHNSIGNTCNTGRNIVVLDAIIPTENPDSNHFENCDVIQNINGIDSYAIS